MPDHPPKATPERAFRPWILPPVWAGIIGFGMLVLARARTMSDPAPLLRIDGWPSWGGIGVLVLGTTLTTWAAAQFVRVGTPLEPGHVPTALVTSGPFRFSRNPIYLGMAIGLVGWAMFLHDAATLVGPIVFVVIIQLRIVRREERLMHAQFGADFDAYCARVRRWI